jgi:hypothetical protein
MKINLINSIVTIRLNSGKMIQINEPMSLVTISSGGALIIEFPNGNSSIYAPSSWEKITTTNREIDNQVVHYLGAKDLSKKKALETVTSVAASITKNRRRIND